MVSYEVTKNANLVQTVIRHKDQKTFKYLIRNMCSLQFLQMQKDKQIWYVDESSGKAASRELPIVQFFRKMLLNSHTISRQKKHIRHEAIRIFVKEVVKNLTQQDPSSNVNLKLLQNYTALQLIHIVLMVPEVKNESLLDGRIKALQQQIRRYNQAQK